MAATGATAGGFIGTATAPAGGLREYVKICGARVVTVPAKPAMGEGGRGAGAGAAAGGGTAPFELRSASLDLHETSVRRSRRGVEKMKGREESEESFVRIAQMSNNTGSSAITISAMKSHAFSAHQPLCDRDVLGYK